MKRFFFILIMLAAFGGGMYWLGHESRSPEIVERPVTQAYRSLDPVPAPIESSFTPPQAAPVSADATQVLEQINREMTEVVAAVQPSVVNLDLERDLDLDRRLAGIPLPDKLQSVGSGVLISHEGHIVTNAHVVAGSDRIKVTLFDDREFDATVIGADILSDIAVLRIQAEDLSPLPWGNSEQLRIGEMVLALGNPLANKNSVSTGIVSAIGRHADDGLGRYENYIQTDASVNPGNSGGALVNIRGELIGINTAIATQSGGFEGISYAIPSKLARFSVESLLKHGRVIRGYLGVAIDDVDGAEAQILGVQPGRGVLVTDVRPDTPAERARLERFDVITGFNGESVRNMSELRLAVAFTPVGEETEVEFYRKGEKQKLPISVDEMPSDIALQTRVNRDGDEDRATAAADQEDEAAEVDTQNVFTGLEVEPLTDKFRQENKLDAEQTGVVVSEVPEGWSRLQPAKGDVITEIRTGFEQVHPITSPADFRKVVRSVAPSQSVHLVYLKTFPDSGQVITRVAFLSPEP
ncbi:MAG: trypsin-like peptidase domain-containing protein [Verrucomicrobiota bacterium]